MAKILMGWESGNGFGHVARMRPIARELTERGHQVVMSLRDVVETAPMLKDEPYPIFQGPYWSRPAPNSSRGRPFSAASYSDILAVSGFANADDLAAMVRAWDGIFEIVRPDIVLSEYAPILVLAARGRFPTILFGNGFVTPPADLPVYPRLQTNVEPVMPQEQVLAVVREVQNRRGAPVPETLPSIFACERRFPCSFPELDPYRKVRREALLPPLSNRLSPLPPPASPRFFAYLAADAPGITTIFSALAKSGVPGGLFLRSPSRRLKDALGKTTITLYEEPPPLPEVLRDASFVIHHGGAGTTEACLTAGRTQILFPRHLEQSMTAATLRGQGIALVIPRNASEDTIAGMVKQAATDVAAFARAQRVAHTIAARDPSPGIAPIIAACEELLAAQRAAG
ncbi:MAG: nucleotide disphospho-sugar-binding domain-containing protein [Alphaproteobacteria bacterium]